MSAVAAAEFQAKGSRRAGYSPNPVAMEERAKSLRRHLDGGSGERSSSGKKIPGLLSLTPSRLLGCIKSGVRRAFGLVNGRGRREGLKRDGSLEAAPARFVPPRDSHHSEAMEDCIEFINSSYRKAL